MLQSIEIATSIFKMCMEVGLEASSTFDLALTYDREVENAVLGSVEPLFFKHNLNKLDTQERMVVLEGKGYRFLRITNHYTKLHKLQTFVLILRDEVLVSGIIVELEIETESAEISSSNLDVKRILSENTTKEFLAKVTC